MLHLEVAFLPAQQHLVNTVFLRACRFLPAPQHLVDIVFVRGCGFLPAQQHLVDSVFVRIPKDLRARTVEDMRTITAARSGRLPAARSLSIGSHN